MAVILLVILFCAYTCKHHVGTTSVHIVDSVRYYYPIIMGQSLKVKMEIQNTGDEALVIDDIQTSWASGTNANSDDADDTQLTDYGIIPAGEKNVFYFNYNSSTNSGEVEHCIRLYANVAPDGVACLKFKVNVVPPTDSSVDYEENHHAEEQHQEVIRGLIDGTENERGYITPEEKADLDE